MEFIRAKSVENEFRHSHQKDGGRRLRCFFCKLDGGMLLQVIRSQEPFGSNPNRKYGWHMSATVRDMKNKYRVPSEKEIDLVLSHLTPPNVEWKLEETLTAVHFWEFGV